MTSTKLVACSFVVGIHQSRRRRWGIGLLKFFRALKGSGVVLFVNFDPYTTHI